MTEAFVASRFHVVHTAPAWMPEYERAVLYGLTVGLAPRNILEIGTFQGGSTLVMSAALDDLGAGRIVCVDPEPRLADTTWNAIRHRASIVAKGSPEAVAEAHEVSGETFDFALIDGDHSRVGVDGDIDATVSVLAEDAHVLFHDAHYHEVAEAIDAAIIRHGGHFDDAGLVSRGHTADENGVLWGGLRLLRYRR